jgi:[ribosomal protein S5]-alanine N-acetyltransferase
MHPRIFVRKLGMADQAAYLASVRRSAALHHPWVKPPATPAQFKLFMQRFEGPSTCALVACVRGTGELVGMFNLSQIVHGQFRSAYLGYYAFAGFERRGLMTLGLKATLRYAFTTLKLHRLEANIQPSNVASVALVKTCGFQLEGYSPRYLKINGRWRDHERWAILAS